MKISYEGKMDEECIDLCNALNALPGITTTESCWGHGRRRYRIWFTARSLISLPRLLYYLDECHSGFPNWRVVATTDCAMSPIVFVLEGPIKGYKQAAHIAKLIFRGICGSRQRKRREHSPLVGAKAGAARLQGHGETRVR